MAKFCSECGCAVAPEAKFCSECGTRIAQNPATSMGFSSESETDDMRATGSTPGLSDEDEYIESDEDDDDSWDPEDVGEYVYADWADVSSDGLLGGLASAMAGRSQTEQLGYFWMDLDDTVVMRPSGSAVSEWASCLGGRAEHVVKYSSLSDRGWTCLQFKALGAFTEGWDGTVRDGVLALGVADFQGTRYVLALSLVAWAQPYVRPAWQRVIAAQVEALRARIAHPETDLNRAQMARGLAEKLAPHVANPKSDNPYTLKWALQKVESYYLQDVGFGGGDPRAMMLQQLKSNERWSPGPLDDLDDLFQPFISSLAGPMVSAFPGDSAMRVGATHSLDALPGATSFFAGWAFPMDGEPTAANRDASPGLGVRLFGGKALMALPSLSTLAASGVAPNGSTFLRELTGCPTGLEESANAFLAEQE